MSFLIIILAISGIAYVFDAIWSLYLSFSSKTTQEKYLDNPRTIKNLVLFIPALNEYSTLKQNLANLIQLTNQPINNVQVKLLFINDGSTDKTGQLLTNIHGHEHVLIWTRHLPNAQQGKGAALQDAIKILKLKGYNPNSTIVGIIDADSHLQIPYLKAVIHAFVYSRYSLIQTRVNIYNTKQHLTNIQNFELNIYNSLLQLCRTHWGSALASGNGQFVTLAMAQQIGWGHSLLEDCEFSLRGLLQGFKGSFLNTVSVEQEGISNIRKLIRQRVRWCQGGIQCLLWYGHKIIISKKIDTLIKFYVLFFLLVPFFSMIIAPASIISFITILSYTIRYNSILGLIILSIILLVEYITNGAMIIKQYNEAHLGKIRYTKLLKTIAIFDLYRWLLAIIPYLSLFKIMTKQNEWVKTKHN